MLIYKARDLTLFSRVSGVCLSMLSEVYTPRFTRVTLYPFKENEIEILNIHHRLMKDGEITTSVDCVYNDKNKD